MNMLLFLTGKEAYFFISCICSSKTMGDLERRMDMPIWIWFVFIGIIVSAVMSIWTARKERMIDEAWIEKEGQKYIDRMIEEKEKRKEA